jgi:hypothetical protein
MKILFVCVALLLPGCVTLQAWERSTVMSRIMADPGNPLEHQLLDHVHAVRESAVGATTAGGASCGCN